MEAQLKAPSLKPSIQWCWDVREVSGEQVSQSPGPSDTMGSYRRCSVTNGRNGKKASLETERKSSAGEDKQGEGN